MRMTLEPRILQEFELCGGATDSLFPQVEARLMADVDAQKALVFVAQSKDVGRYASMMDFLFCETFPEHRSRCLKFYAQDGPPLRQTLSELPVWKFYHRVMLGALEFAKAAHRQGDKIAWSWFVSVLKRAVKEQGS
jgi:hypothetical protein